MRAVCAVAPLALATTACGAKPDPAAIYLRSRLFGVGEPTDVRIPTTGGK